MHGAGGAHGQGVGGGGNGRPPAGSFGSAGSGARSPGGMLLPSLPEEPGVRGAGVTSARGEGSWGDLLSGGSTTLPPTLGDGPRSSSRDSSRSKATALSTWATHTGSLFQDSEGSLKGFASAPADALAGKLGPLTGPGSGWDPSAARQLWGQVQGAGHPVAPGADRAGTPVEVTDLAPLQLMLGSGDPAQIERACEQIERALRQQQDQGTSPPPGAHEAAVQIGLHLDLAAVAVAAGAARRRALAQQAQSREQAEKAEAEAEAG